MTEDVSGRKRVVIEGVRPEVDGGRFPIKRVVGERVAVEADVFCDGHDAVSAVLLYRRDGETKWRQTPLKPLVNDRWRGMFVVDEMTPYRYTVEAWSDPFRSWQAGLRKKLDAGQDVAMDLLIGARYVEEVLPRARGADREELEKLARTLRNLDPAEAAFDALSERCGRIMAGYPDENLTARYEKELMVVVERTRAGFSTWYELFPRSWSEHPGEHGTLRDCERLLPEIAAMGFDVLYLPPIHPIGTTHRKGSNNSPVARPEDPGSPWAIGGKEGGHKAVHPQLGTLEDVSRLVQSATRHGIEVALDLAFQCSMDHPYVADHPDWFRWRPDGTIQYAENPPKKYQDVVPFDFETDGWWALWQELKSIVSFWIDQGIRIFRVDNPHTKPFAFWQWLIGEIRSDHPEVLFLAEAFTRPKVMQRLAKIGFAQSYTYFTWRNTKREITEYLGELTRSEVCDTFRPNFWPNTPDILPEYLQHGGRPAFIARLVLAATLSSNYGVYGPAFELCVADALPGREEYQDSEKYQIRQWHWDQPGNLKDLIARVNHIRRRHPALQTTRNLTFHEVDNDYLLFYGKVSDDLSDLLLIVVNLDPFHTQTGRVRVPLEELGIAPGQPYLLHDLLGDEKYIWQGEWNRIELNPHTLPAQIFAVHRRLRRESDFDYFM